MAAGNGAKRRPDRFLQVNPNTVELRITTEDTEEHGGKNLDKINRIARIDKKNRCFLSFFSS